MAGAADELVGQGGASGAAVQVCRQGSAFMRVVRKSWLAGVCAIGCLRARVKRRGSSWRCPVSGIRARMCWVRPVFVTWVPDFKRIWVVEKPGAHPTMISRSRRGDAAPRARFWT